MRRIVATIALVATLTLAAGCVARSEVAPVPTSTTYSQDCRLGPSDCGYGDNGSNGDR